MKFYTHLSDLIGQHFINKPLLSVSVLSAAMLSSQVHAFDVEHEAHVHGHASLNVVVEGKELQIAFKSPAMNIVGFEHAAKSKQDKEKLRQAVAQLKNTEAIFDIDSDAGCKFEHVQVSSALMEDDDHHGKHDHDEHHHDHHDEHDHDSHHDEHEGHGEEHSEFESEYHFECKDVNKLGKINVGLFKVFPSLEEVEAQVITKNKQKLVELTSGKTLVEFK